MAVQALCVNSPLDDCAVFASKQNKLPAIHQKNKIWGNYSFIFHNHNQEIEGRGFKRFKSYSIIIPLVLQGLALLMLSWDKNWDSHSLVNGYPSFYPRIALVAPSPGMTTATMAGHKYTVRCHSNAVYFPKYIQNTSHSLPVRERYGMYFVNSNCDLYSASVTEVMWEISSYIGSCYNGTWLY